jgi:hypothetical protein
VGEEPEEAAGEREREGLGAQMLTKRRHAPKVPRERRDASARGEVPRSGRRGVEGRGP